MYDNLFDPEVYTQELIRDIPSPISTSYINKERKSIQK